MSFPLQALNTKNIDQGNGFTFRVKSSEVSCCGLLWEDALNA